MLDDLLPYAWLMVSAFLAGGVNALAGGGTLLTFPTLMSMDGVSADMANGTSTVALFPGSVASAVGFREELRGCVGWVMLLSAPSLLGGAVGALLVKEDSFRTLVPWLILAAAVIFLFQPLVVRWLRKHEPNPGAKTTLRGQVQVILAQFAISVYGGYFGAGIGILMLSSLSFLPLASLHQVNALKTFLAFLINATAAVIFIARGLVAWPYALAMMATAILGGYVGARLALRLSPSAVRLAVICIGFGLSAYYFVKG